MVQWQLADRALVVDINLPEGVSALLDINGRDPVELATGTHHLTWKNVRRGG
jgi:hypothetical protein